MSSLDRTLIALADPTRRHVVNLLRRGPRSAGELALASNMSAPAMSRHLRVLRRTELVEERGAEHDARLRIYRLRRQPFAELLAWLEDIEAFWKDELDAFKAHAERRGKGGKK
jgi:DNA-binding transcriptional ArsR family regulator